jgi:hypothetical protein
LRDAYTLSVEWGEVVYSMLVAAAVYGCWKGVSALVAREQRSPRKLLRYLWPTAMLAWSWFMLWATSFPGSSRWMGKSLDLLLILFFTVNLPAAVLGNALLVLLIDWPGPAKASVASLCVWLLWFAIIRVWERWKSRGAATALLRITPPRV